MVAWGGRSGLVGWVLIALLMQGIVPVTSADGADCAMRDYCVHDDEIIDDAVMVLRGDLRVLGNAVLTIRDSTIVFREPNAGEAPRIVVAQDARLVLQDVEVRVEETTLTAVLEGQARWTRTDIDRLDGIVAKGAWTGQGGHWILGEVDASQTSTLHWTDVDVDTSGGNLTVRNQATVADGMVELRPLHDPEEPAKGRADAMAGSVVVADEGRLDIRSTTVRGAMACHDNAALQADRLELIGRGTLFEVTCPQVRLQGSTLDNRGTLGVALHVGAGDVVIESSALQSRGHGITIEHGDLHILHTAMQVDRIGLVQSGGTSTMHETVLMSAADAPVDCSNGHLVSHGGAWVGKTSGHGACGLYVRETTLSPGLLWSGHVHPFGLVAVGGDQPDLTLSGPGIVFGGPGSAPLGHVAWSAGGRLDALPADPLVAATAGLNFWDRDGDGSVDDDEPLYFGPGGSVTTGDLRIPRDGTSSLVSAADSDHGRSLQPVPGRLMEHADHGLLVWDDGDGQLSPADIWLAGGMVGLSTGLDSGALQPVGAITSSNTMPGFVVDDGDQVLGDGDLILSPGAWSRPGNAAATAQLMATYANSAHFVGAVDLAAVHLGSDAPALLGEDADILAQDVRFTGPEQIHLKPGSQMRLFDGSNDADSNTIEGDALLEAFVRFAPRVIYPNGVPVEGAQLAASQGDETVATGITGADGTAFVVDRDAFRQDASGVDEADAIAVKATLRESEQTRFLRPGIDVAEVVLPDDEGPAGPLQLARADGARNTPDVAIKWSPAEDDMSSTTYRVVLAPAHDGGTIIVDGEKQSFTEMELTTTSQTSHQVTLPGQGAYLIRVAALDANGNVGSVDELPVAWDERKPTLQHALAGDLRNGWYRNDVVLEVDARDAESGIEELRVQVDGDRLEPVDGRVVISGDGYRRIQLDALDVAGNVASRTIDIRIDSTPPLIPALSADRTLLRQAGTIQISFSGSFVDALSGLDRVELHVESSTGDEVLERYLAPLPSGATVHAPSGRTDYTLVAVDRAGNEKRSDPLKVIVDDAAPRLRNAINGTLGLNQSLVLELLDDSGIASFVVYVNGIVVAQSSSTRTELHGGDLGAGRHFIEVVATDQVGNSARYEGTVDVRDTSTDKKSPMPLLLLVGGLGLAAWRRRCTTHEEQTI